MPTNTKGARIPNRIIHTPAKLNLFLAVNAQIVDGRHTLTSVFCTLELADQVSFAFQSGSQPFDVRVQTTPEALVPNKDNIMLRAWRLFVQSHGLASLPTGTLQVELNKTIPLQAGLGGGSTNAAAMLKILCELTRQDPLAPKNLHIASRLGADVTFFLYASQAGGCALMNGAGDRLVRMLPKPELDIVLVKPSEGIATVQAYASFDADPQPAPSASRLVSVLESRGQTLAIAEACVNNLEPAAKKLLSKIANIKSELKAQAGVLTALLCGSGSTVFGICDSADSAQAAARYFSGKGLWAQATRT
ncbi:MAG: 4-(cytidine 5'-diphospho)-2-C-methyl-D-erythritol kinase [Coriobacteriales bacterium]|nr:4-(cytidine 5'-diphospho)-2-C-methyl-D-erythritol kinase [Coriobacteriales bacterium]